MGRGGHEYVARVTLHPRVTIAEEKDFAVAESCTTLRIISAISPTPAASPSTMRPRYR